MATPSTPEGKDEKMLSSFSQISFLGSEESLLHEFFAELFRNVVFRPEFSVFTSEGLVCCGLDYGPSFSLFHFLLSALRLSFVIIKSFSKSVLFLLQ